MCCSDFLLIKRKLAPANHYYAGKEYMWTSTTPVLCSHYSSVLQIYTSQLILKEHVSTETNFITFYKVISC
jgi:hypothetical protein